MAATTSGVNRNSGRSVTISAAIVIALAVLLGLVRELGSNPGQQAASGVLGSVAFTVLVATPPVIALFGLGDRPCLLVMAGVALLPLSLLSAVTLPLVIPATIFFLSGAAELARGHSCTRAGVVAAVLAATFVIAGGLSMLVHEDPTSWTTEHGGGSTSDVVTTQEALAGLGFFAAAISVSALTPGSPSRRHSHRPR